MSRGENLDKDKIRLDQKLPTMEYSLIFDDGKLWGLINGAAFTPRQDAAPILSPSIITALNHCCVTKNVDPPSLWLAKNSRKGSIFSCSTSSIKRSARPVITSVPDRCGCSGWSMRKAFRVETPVKYTRKFLDYRIVQQTLVPYRIVLLEDGRQSQETRVLTITYGVKVSDSIFKNPEG